MYSAKSSIFSRVSNSVSPPIDASVVSNWSQPIKPEINKVVGNYTIHADSHVIVGYINQHTSILSIALIVIAVLFIIHFVVQLYDAHFRYFRGAERNKFTTNLPNPVVAVAPRIV